MRLECIPVAVALEPPEMEPPEPPEPPEPLEPLELEMAELLEPEMVEPLVQLELEPLAQLVRVPALELLKLVLELGQEPLELETVEATAETVRTPVVAAEPP